MTKERRRITIKDVAEACGVVPSTVSNALRGKAYVAPHTRKAIEQAAARLGYRVSPIARALRTQRSFSVGVLVADIANPTFPTPDFGRAGALSVRPMQYDIETPRVHVFNLSVQRALPLQSVLTVGYAGARGQDLWRNTDANTAIPVQQSDGSWFYPAGTPRRLDVCVTPPGAPALRQGPRAGGRIPTAGSPRSGGTRG